MSIIEEGTEVRLLRRWRSGDRTAGDLLMRRYWPMLKAFFRRKRAANVEELVQSTLVACMQAINRFAERSSFKAYLLGIARNQFLMSLRSESAGRFEAPVMSTAPENSPSRVFALEQGRRLLAAAVLRLPGEFRTVLTLFYWDGCSVEEIALLLGVPVGTVKSRLARSRAILKGRLLSPDLSNEARAGLSDLLDTRES
jgi:RNA polymerase sigma factor (sigma-70 family)